MFRRVRLWDLFPHDHKLIHEDSSSNKAKLMQKQLKSVVENEKLPDENKKAKKKDNTSQISSKRYFDAYVFVFDSSSYDSFQSMKHLLTAI